MNIQALSSTAPLSTPNNYLFNGNEEQTDFDWAVYDFNARGYDPASGRFMQIDPLAESQDMWTPYHFSYNSPIRLNDPSGLAPSESLEEFTQRIDSEWAAVDSGENPWHANFTSNGRGAGNRGGIDPKLRVSLPTNYDGPSLEDILSGKWQPDQKGGTFFGGYYSGLWAGLKGTWNFFYSDIWKRSTWEGMGNFVLGAALGGDPMTLLLVDSHLGTNTFEAIGSFANSIDSFVNNPPDSWYEWGFAWGYFVEKGLEVTLTARVLPVSKRSVGLPVLPGASRYTTRSSMDLYGALGRMSQRRSWLPGMASTIDRGTFINRNFIIPSGRIVGVGQLQYLNLDNNNK